MKLKFRSQKGQASGMFLVLAIIFLIAIVVVYIVIRMSEKPPEPPPVENPDGTTEPQIILPIYETTVGNIRFVFQSALDKGSIMRTSEAITHRERVNIVDMIISNNGAKFVKVTIGAQNIGLYNTEQGAWDIENIVDSNGRNFVPVSYSIDWPWIPDPNLCGELLKPIFAPTPCVKIYEVSKESTGLKIRVLSAKDGIARNLFEGKVDSALIDLIVK